MERTRLLIVLGLFVVLGLSAAVAGEHPEARTLAFPLLGFSIDAPEGWVVDQTGDAPLELSKDGVRVWVRPYDGPADRVAERTWTKLEEGGLRAAGLVARGDAAVFEVEASLPAGQEGLRDAVDGMLDSLDTTPYVHATRTIDWAQGWQLDLPADWTWALSPRRVARFEAADGPAWIEVDDWYRVNGKEGPVAGADGATIPDTWLTEAWQKALARLEKEAGVATKDTPTIETLEAVKFLGGEAVPPWTAQRIHLGLNPNDAGRPTAWLSVLVVGPWRVTAFSPDGPLVGSIQEACASLRFELNPGPRAGESDETEANDVFTKGGPPVVFALPEGWEMREGSNQMRLAEWNLPGQDSVVGIVYYFGDGGGGPIDDNLKRWKGQMGSDVEAQTEVMEIAEGVKAHWLDALGSYSPGMGAGNPHAGTHGGFRMLAVVLEVPEGPLFVKLVGPTDVIGEHEEAIKAWIQSFRVSKN